MAKKAQISLFSTVSEGCLKVPDGCSSDVASAVTYFNKGNFAECRKLCSQITTSSDFSKEDKNFARELLDRTGTDHVILYIALSSIVLLIFIILWSWTKSH
ncbi:hypothetical protein KKF34_15535 [Myxococcota bacterium]|nr:hypothetical protein [Myxococcota bacterium]MBU1382735.1 hypothetical protein [Myxococcota bacterium]MBU1498287.1 hypothetical protein [Myxococcota bacterium]